MDLHRLLVERVASAGPALAGLDEPDPLVRAGAASEEGAGPLVAGRPAP